MNELKISLGTSHASYRELSISLSWKGLEPSRSSDIYLALAYQGHETYGANN